MDRQRTASMCAMVLALLGAVSSTNGQTFTGLSGTDYHDPTNWSPEEVPDRWDWVLFPEIPLQTVSLSTFTEVKRITFDSPQGYLVSSPVGALLDLRWIASSVQPMNVRHQIDTGVSTQGSLGVSIEGVTELEITGGLEGSGRLTKYGTGRLILSGDNSGFAGTIAVAQGTIEAGVNNSIADTSTIEVYSGATLVIVQVEDVGSVSASRLFGSGSIVMDADLGIGNDNASMTFDGVISGDASLSKLGSGTQVLTGASTYMGVTDILAGAVMANNASGSATGSNGINVQNGATFGGFGNVDGDVAVMSGGTLVPGDGVGILTVDGVTFATGAIFPVELTGLIQGSEHDALFVDNTANLAGTLLLDVSALDANPGDSFVILEASQINGTFGTVDIPAACQTWSIAYSATQVTAVVDNDTPPTVVDPVGAYSDASPKLYGCNRDVYYFRNAPVALFEVTLNLSAWKNLDATNESARVTIGETIVVEELFATTGKACRVSQEDVFIPSVVWNAARELNQGDVRLQVDYRQSGVCYCSNGGWGTYTVDYLIDEDCDNDGLHNQCEAEDCDNNGMHDACQWDDDGDGVIDECDACEGFDDALDTDGDGIPDACDQCADEIDADGDGVGDVCDQCEGFDDTIDCNGDGFPDACQLIGAYADAPVDADATCNVGGFTMSIYNTPPAFGDVTINFEISRQNVDEVGESIDLYANGVLVTTMFAGVADCTNLTAVTVPQADWNNIRALHGASKVEFQLLRNAASCAGEDVDGFCWPYVIMDVAYTADRDLNDNGWLDECLPDCVPTGPDSDGDGVVDSCDQCSDTIPDPSIVEAYGCPIHVGIVDTDGDGDVDVDDSASLDTELNGPDVASLGLELDTDDDGDLDVADAGKMLRCVRGRDVTADPSCLGPATPNYLLVEHEYPVAWSYGDRYSRGIYGTHMAAVDKTLLTSEQDQIDEMTALAATDPGISTWLGLWWDGCRDNGEIPGSSSCDIPGNHRPNKWFWSNGIELLETDASAWSGATTPEPGFDSTGLVDFAFMSTASNPQYRWMNTLEYTPSSLFNLHNFAVQLPFNNIPTVPPGAGQSIELSLSSSVEGQAVAAGATVDWEITATVSSYDNLGLAMLVADLVQDTGNPALFDIPQADGVPAAMSAFAAPAGISNPAENGAASGYVGVQRGTPGAMNLVQIGGAQSNLGEPLPGGTVGQDVSMESGVGQAMLLVIASGSFTAPATLGEYTFSLENVISNVIHTLNVPPAASIVFEPAIDQSAGTMTFSVLAIANDLCATATAIGEGLHFGTTTDAAADGTSSCGNTGSSPDVYYSYTASCNGAAIAQTCGAGTSYDTVVNVFDVCGGSQIVCNDDGCGPTDTTSRAVWSVSAATEYLIRVTGYGGNSGDFELSVQCEPTPANDDCANATNVGDGSYLGSLAAASIDGPGPCGITDSRDIWYAYTNTGGADLLVTASLCNEVTDFDSVIAAYDACGGVEVACNDDDPDWCQLNEVASAMTWTVPCGATHWIQVASYGDIPGEFQMDVSSVTDPANTDSDGDGVADACDLCQGNDATGDADSDGVCDDIDACPGFDDSVDPDGDGVPTGCDLCPNDNPDDTDSDSVCDSDDVCPGFDDTVDTDTDGVPDGCDACPGGDDNLDTDGDGVAEFCDNCPLDNPDDPDADDVCTSDDNCDLYNPEQNDCQPNGVGDACDIAAGATDDNENGVPDECELQPPGLPEEWKHQAKKHRYLSIDPSTSAPNAVAIKVEIAEMLRCQNDPRRGCLVDEDCRDVCEDEPNILCISDAVCGGGSCISSGPCVDVTPDPPVAWVVQEPMQIQAGCLAPGCNPAAENCCGDEDWVARLSDTVYSQDWSEYSLIHISDCGIVPGITYNVYACDPTNTDICSEPLAVGTQETPSGTPRHFGDIAGSPVNAGDPYGPPDGFVNVVDVSAWGLTKQNYGTFQTPQLHPTMADLHGSGYGAPANYILGLSDQQAIINHGFTWALPWDNPDMLGGVDPSTCPGTLP